jgi:hypothetical protein
MPFKRVVAQEAPRSELDLTYYLICRMLRLRPRLVLRQIFLVLLSNKKGGSMLNINTRIGRVSLVPILICIVLIGGLFLFGKGKVDVPRLYQLVQGGR